MTPSQQISVAGDIFGVMMGWWDNLSGEEIIENTHNEAESCLLILDSADTDLASLPAEAFNFVMYPVSSTQLIILHFVVQWNEASTIQDWGEKLMNIPKITFTQ